jgi:hypothetical protein
MEVKLDCTYSHTDKGKHYFNHGADSYKKLKNILKTYSKQDEKLKGAFNKKHFYVPSPKYPIGTLGGADLCVFVEPKIVSFKSRLEHNKGQNVRFMQLYLTNIVRV